MNLWDLTRKWWIAVPMVSAITTGVLYYFSGIGQDLILILCAFLLSDFIFYFVKVSRNSSGQFLPEGHSYLKFFAVIIFSSVGSEWLVGIIQGFVSLQAITLLNDFWISVVVCALLLLDMQSHYK